MFLSSSHIHAALSPSEIVATHYRTAEIFRRYGIGFCCGGNWPIETVCRMQGIDLSCLEADLQAAVRSLPAPDHTEAGEWSIDFLMDYIIRIHHGYIRRNLPQLQAMLSGFIAKHHDKYDYLGSLQQQLSQLERTLSAAMKNEEDILFPYIRQVAHAHDARESYTHLLIKTLRKPAEQFLYNGHDELVGLVHAIRKTTNQYLTPEKSCTSHKVLLQKLREMDDQLIHHLSLEQKVLFPKAIGLETAVLQPGTTSGNFQ